MQMIETAIRPISFARCSVAYRGINAEQFERMKKARLLVPRSPLRTTAEMIALFSASLPMAHVLEKKREHFLSFSLQIGSALWYGTSGGTTDGYVVEVQLVDGTGVIEGSDAPASYACSDGTQWIDPRHISVGIHLLDWSRFHSRAVVDQEVLLAGGAVHPARIYRVLKNQCDQRYAPWAATGERITMF